MSIPFACSCGRSFKAKDEFAGKRTKCPDCGQILTVPLAPPADQLTPVSGGAAVTPPPQAAPVAATSAWGDEDAAAETTSHDAPRAKKHPRRRSPVLLIVVGVLVIALAGVGGVVGWIWYLNRDTGKPIDRSARGTAKATQQVKADDPNEAASKLDLGEDLNLVPKDVVGFAAVRVADLMASPLVQQLRKQPLARFLPDPDQELERRLGLKPADIERVTFVAPKTGLLFWVVAYTRQPYDQAKILQLLGPTKTTTLRGKTYHASETSTMAVCFLKDRVLIAGPEDGVRLAIAPPETIAKGMAIPLKLAATERHTVTAALQIPTIILTVIPLPPALKPYEAIQKTIGVTMTVDAADGLTMIAKLDYLDEDAAKNAETAANALLKRTREQLAQLKPGAAGQEPGDPVMQPVFKLADKLVQNIPIRRHGKTVEIQCQVDGQTAASAPAILLPALEKIRQAVERAFRDAMAAPEDASK